MLSVLSFCLFIEGAAADAGDGAACAEALDFGSTEPELFENLSSATIRLAEILILYASWS